MLRSIIFNVLLVLLIASSGILTFCFPAQADAIDPFVRRYLANEPVELSVDSQGHTQSFSPEDLTEGKILFESSCLNCHAGGINLVYSDISLTLEDLQGATPPRDTINRLVEYFRYPLSYDGSDTNYWCREIPETWMPQPEAEKLAAYILRSAEVDPSWGGQQQLKNSTDIYNVDPFNVRVR